VNEYTRGVFECAAYMAKMVEDLEGTSDLKVRWAELKRRIHVVKEDIQCGVAVNFAVKLREVAKV